MRTKLLCLPILLLSSLLLGCSQKKKDYSITSGNSSSQEGPIESFPSAPRISESRMPLPSRFVVDHVKYALSGDTAIAQGPDEDSLGEKEISIGLTKDSDFSYTIPCKIGVFAFKDCSRLKKVSFRGEILGIGYGAFRFCSSLTSVSIPSSVQYIGQGAFAGCDSLEAITVEKENPNFFRKTVAYTIKTELCFSPVREPRRNSRFPRESSISRNLPSADAVISKSLKYLLLSPGSVRPPFLTALPWV